MFNNIASALVANLGLHVFTYIFSLTSQKIAIILGVQFLTCILSQPIWSSISKKIDKKQSMLLGIVICIISSLIFVIMVIVKYYIRGNLIYFLPFAIIAGFGTGGLFTLPLSMVADVIDLDELNTGKRSEGSYYGCLTLLYKLSQSLTLFLIGFVLDFVKFDSSNILGLLLGIGSAVCFTAALFSLLSYNLSSNKVAEIQKKISETKDIRS
jgi:Na+/melibiose symporter-like transporter